MPSNPSVSPRILSLWALRMMMLSDPDFQFPSLSVERLKKSMGWSKGRIYPLDGAKKWQIDFNLFSAPCQSLEICPRQTAGLNLKWIQNGGVAFLVASLKTFNRFDQSARRYFRDMRVNIEIWGQISVWTPRNSDPGAYLRPSSTVEVICFHGTPPIYQQGRAIKVAITHIGALPPEMHRFDARCASRCRHGQSLMRCELDRGGWIGKPGETKRAMSAQVLLCRFALSQTPASRCNPSRRLVILRVHRSAVSIFSIIRCYVMVCDSCYKNNWGFVENHLLTLNWVCLTECWGTDQS